MNIELENKIARRKAQQYQANLRYTLKKAELGQCQYSGCKEVAAFMCPKHLKVKAIQRKNWLSKRRSINSPK